MTRARTELIDDLVRDLRPSRGPRRIETLAALWLAVSLVFVVAALRASAPFRPGWLAQLADAPQLLGESALGLGAASAAMAAALRLGQPGSRLRACLALAGAALGAWLAALLAALVAPAVEPSLLGQRDGCALEVLLFGAPPMLLGLLLLRRLAPLSRPSTGMLVGAASGALPALMMQLACMYVPAHNLVFHAGPVALLAAAGALLGPLLLRRI